MSLEQLLDALLSGADPHEPKIHERMMTLCSGVRVDGPQASHHAYGRDVLCADERGEVLLMRWGAGRVCMPHDHDDASGFMVMLEGAFVERTYAFEDGALHHTETHAAQSPHVVHFGPSRIHDMTSPDGGLSLHVYRPCITNMRVFDPQNQRTLVVNERCGAWVPQDTTMILSQTPWSTR